MLKSSILNYHTYLKNPLKSSWLTLLVILSVAVPVIVFGLFIIFETEIAASLMSLFPPEKRQGVAFYEDLVYIARVEVLWFGFFLLLTLILAVYPPQGSLLKVLNVRSRTRAIYYMMLIASAFTFATVLVGSKTLEFFPNSADEYAYIFQAQMFSDGKLWEKAHDLPGFFNHIHIPQHEGIRVSRFPPGWPLLLSISYEAGFAPFLVNLVLGLIALVVFYFFARRYYSQSIAIWGLFLLAFCGYYIFNSASYFSHVSCLLMTLLFVFSIYRYQERNEIIYALLAGFFIGFVMIIRYYTAVLIFLPFLLYLLLHYRMKAFYLFVWMAIGTIPCIAYLLWYNYSITGDALLPVTVWAYPNEQLGFVRGHTFMKGVEHLIRRTLMFFYWCSPGLLILYCIYLWRKIKTPTERLVHPGDYAFLMLTVGYFFYYEIGGNQYGPRFMFEAFPFMILFIVSKVIERREKWAVALLVASMVYPIVKLPFIAYREELIVDQRKDVYDLVEEKKITNAVVFLASPTSPIRPMPAEDLTRNDAHFADDVIYVLELPNITDQLIEYYDDRAIYKYVRELNNPQGELHRIR